MAACAGQASAVLGISPPVKFECMVGPVKRGDPVLERAYVDVFELFVPLAMPDPVYLHAAQLRARFGLKSRTPCTRPVHNIMAATPCGQMTTACTRHRTVWRE